MAIRIVLACETILSRFVTHFSQMVAVVVHLHNTRTCSLFQVVVNVVLLITANVVGLMARHIAEKHQRESFVRCRAYIGAKIQFQEQGQKLVS